MRRQETERADDKWDSSKIESHIGKRDGNSLEVIHAKTRRVKVVTNGEPSLMQWWWTSTDGDGAQGGRTKELNYVKVALSGVWRLLLFFSSLTAE